MHRKPSLVIGGLLVAALALPASAKAVCPNPSSTTSDVHVSVTLPPPPPSECVYPPPLDPPPPPPPSSTAYTITADANYYTPGSTTSAKSNKYAHGYAVVLIKRFNGLPKANASFGSWAKNHGAAIHLSSKTRLENTHFKRTTFINALRDGREIGCKITTAPKGRWVRDHDKKVMPTFRAKRCWLS